MLGINIITQYKNKVRHLATVHLLLLYNSISCYKLITILRVDQGYFATMDFIERLIYAMVPFFYILESSREKFSNVIDSNCEIMYNLTSQQRNLLPKIVQFI